MIGWQTFVGVVKSIQPTKTLKCFIQFQPNLAHVYRLFHAVSPLRGTIKKTTSSNYAELALCYVLFLPEVARFAHIALEITQSRFKIGKMQIFNQKTVKSFRVIRLNFKSSFKSWIPSQSQVKSFINVSQASLKPYSLQLESDLSHGTRVPHLCSLEY